MKRQKKNSLFYDFFVILLIVLCATVIFTFVKLYYISSDIKNINQHINSYKDPISNPITLSTSDVIGKTSLFLSIYSAGIGLFGIFGGILSFVNLRLSKDLETGINNAKNTLENQKELRAWRLIQEGRNYIFINRPKYAKDCFKMAMLESNKSFTYYVVKLQILSLYVIETYNSPNELIITINRFIRFYNSLKNNSNHKVIRIEVSFILGCLYDNLAKILNVNIYALVAIFINL